MVTSIQYQWPPGENPFEIQGKVSYNSRGKLVESTIFTSCHVYTCAHTQEETTGIWIAMCSFWLLISGYKARMGSLQLFLGCGQSPYCSLFRLLSSYMVTWCLLLEDKTIWKWMHVPGVLWKQLCTFGPDSPIWTSQEGLSDPRLPLGPPTAPVQLLPGRGKPNHSACGQQMGAFVGITIMRGPSWDSDLRTRDARRPATYQTAPLSKDFSRMTFKDPVGH